MKTRLTLLAGTLAAGTLAIAATPAMAQLGGTLGGTVGGAVSGTTATVGGAGSASTHIGTGLDTAATAGSAMDHVGTAVDKTDKAASKTSEPRSMRVATSDQLSSGVTVRDASGNEIGTISSVTGDTALVANKGQTYRVPLSELYAKGSGKVKEVTSRLPAAELSADAHAGAHGSASTGD